MPNECNLTVVESTTDDNGYDSVSGALRVGEIDASSVKDMVDKIIAHARANECCIKSLTIIGHGCPGNISIGNGQGGADREKEINGNNENVWGPELDRLKPFLCTGATIYLRGCNVGADQAGADKLRAIARRLGVDVTAPTGLCNPLWTEGQDQTATPTTTPTPIPAPVSKKKKLKKIFGNGNKIYYRQNTVTRVVDVDTVARAFIQSRRAKTAAGYKSKRLPLALLKEVKLSLATYEPVPANQPGLKIEAFLDINLKPPIYSRVHPIPVSYLCVRANYLVLGGDWSMLYPMSPKATKALQKYIV